MFKHYWVGNCFGYFSKNIHFPQFSKASLVNNSKTSLLSFAPDVGVTKFTIDRDMNLVRHCCAV
jgi:hypothetical protein